ncbi:MAG TPA: hypothetical protein ENJ06_06760, partial [Phycisphaeraceae bacterium]|nr:hypothetical protein [Phycisphaeraceae bacterium]
SRPGSYYDISFAELLHKWKQPPGAVAKFWDFFIRSTCNAPVQQVAAEYALMVFRMAFLAGPKAAAMGISEAPLSETYKNVNAIIEKSQGRVVTGERVTGFSLDEEECLSAVITSKNKYKADIYISALPRQVLLQLSEKYLPRINSELKNAKFESSPIICAHLWFKQTVMPCPHLALPGRETEWIFDRTRSGEQGQYLCALRSAADSWVKASEDEIITKVMSDLREALPGTAIEDPYRARVIKEKRATFIPAPGLEKHRPDTFTNINNLFIAGDFCRTGWPATMESAVRSGNKAARAAIRYLSGKNGD